MLVQKLIPKNYKRKIKGLIDGLIKLCLDNSVSICPQRISFPLVRM
jgi:hypothetical protein